LGGHKIKTPPPTTADEHQQRPNEAPAGAGLGVALAPDDNPTYRTVPPLMAIKQIGTVR
jgi:hypothetical protein